MVDFYDLFIVGHPQSITRKNISKVTISLHGYASCNNFREASILAHRGTRAFNRQPALVLNFFDVGVEIIYIIANVNTFNYPKHFVTYGLRPQDCA